MSFLNPLSLLSPVAGAIAGGGGKKKVVYRDRSGSEPVPTARPQGSTSTSMIGGAR